MLTYGQRLEQQGFDKGFDKGVEKGIETGMEKGMEKGVEKGIEKGQRTTLLRLLTRRFGTLPQPVAERVDAASPADIERWLDRILDATSLDDVIATP